MPSATRVSARTAFSNVRIQASLVVLAGLLLAPFAHAQKAVEPGAAPHWSAYIGSGHVSASHLPERDAASPTRAGATQPSIHAPSPHPSARIGTGRVSSGESSQRSTAAVDVTREAGAPASAPHWSSRIGTGSAIGS